MMIRLQIIAQMVGTLVDLIKMFLVISIPKPIYNPVELLKPKETKSIVLEIKINRFMRISYRANVSVKIPLQFRKPMKI